MNLVSVNLFDNDLMKLYKNQHGWQVGIDNNELVTSVLNFVEDTTNIIGLPACRINLNRFTEKQKIK